MQEIRKWIEQANPDFDRGFALFCQYSRNQSLIKYIGRKRQMQVLRYELEKFSTMPNLTPNPFYKANLVQFGGIIESTKPVEVVKEKKVVVIDDRRVNRADLPVALQEVYDVILEDYKLQRSVHEKMKAANSDEGRAAFRSQLVELTTKIKANWAIIDQGFIPEEAGIPVSGISSQVNSARAYISKMISKDLNDDQRELIKAKMKIIMDAGATLKPETLQKLKDKGF
jgi:hypothetical protein